MNERKNRPDAPDRDNSVGDGMMSDKALDALLNTAPAPEASDALMARLLEGYDDAVNPGGAVREAPQTLAGLWRMLTKGWLGVAAPSGAVAALSAAGFFAGALSLSTAPAAADEEALLYADAAIAASLGFSEEGALWDVE